MNVRVTLVATPQRSDLYTSITHVTVCLEPRGLVLRDATGVVAVAPAGTVLTLVIDNEGAVT